MRSPFLRCLTTGSACGATDYTRWRGSMLKMSILTAAALAAIVTAPVAERATIQAAVGSKRAAKPRARSRTCTGRDLTLACQSAAGWRWFDAAVQRRYNRYNWGPALSR